MFATFPGGMASAFSAKKAAGSHTIANCHETMTPSAGSLATGHDHDTDSHGHDAPADAPQPQHGCCTGFVGILSVAALSPVIPRARESVLFLPSLRLISRTADIYHPPRQSA
ncbi:MAG: hypothetical protein LBK55_11320 [Azoarcus sp.]|nr:hypothetical protein [Azoarcus sp.]